MYNVSCGALAVCIAVFYVGLFTHNMPLWVAAFVVAAFAAIIASFTEEV